MYVLSLKAARYSEELLSQDRVASLQVMTRRLSILNKIIERRDLAAQHHMLKASKQAEAH